MHIEKIIVRSGLTCMACAGVTGLLGFLTGSHVLKVIALWFMGAFMVIGFAPVLLVVGYSVAEFFFTRK